jgi:hypothetical protein
MITDVDPLPERYRRWEARNVARFGGWSMRRRWLTFVLVPTMILCCGGTALGAPAAWLLGTTIEASRGAATPDAAANEYLLALSYDNEDGLLAVLDNDNQDELLTAWHAYRATMSGTTPPPSSLDFGPLAVGPVADGRAEVSAEVRATWWGDLAYQSESHTWRFTTRQDNGWQIEKVEPPAWCGGYVRADACK